MKRLLIILTVSAFVVCAAKGQVPNVKSTTQEEPPLGQLTDAERALDFRSIVANQPNFVAAEIFFYGEGFGGFSAKRHVARKGDRYSIDTGYVKVITDRVSEIRLNDGNKTFEQTPMFVSIEAL